MENLRCVRVSSNRQAMDDNESKGKCKGELKTGWMNDRTYEHRFGHRERARDRENIDRMKWRERLSDITTSSSFWLFLLLHIPIIWMFVWSLSLADGWNWNYEKIQLEIKVCRDINCGRSMARNDGSWRIKFSFYNDQRLNSKFAPIWISNLWMNLITHGALTVERTGVKCSLNHVYEICSALQYVPTTHFHMKTTYATLK